MIRDNTFIELRGYLNIIKRRWPMLVMPAIGVLLVALVAFRVPKPTYRIGIQFIVGQNASEEIVNNAEQRQWEWVASQYVVNSMTDWSNGSEFAELVRLKLLQPQYGEYDIELEPLAEAIEAFTIRSRMTTFVNYEDEEETTAIAHAIVAVFDDVAAGRVNPLPQAGTVPPQLVPLDVITPPLKISASPIEFIQWPLRIGVAVGTGLIFALILEYLDPRIHEKRQLEAIDIPVVGSIPH